jgi:hypothetical protein
MTKVCFSCKVEKSRLSFSKNKARKDGLHSYCKDCCALKRNKENEQKYYSENKEKYRENLLRWQRANRDKTRASSRKYYSENRSEEIARSAKKRVSRDLARPTALTKEQAHEIQNFYWLAQDLRAVTGEEYHVDHIVPLNGKNICGLHVPWNLQVLPADINLSKGNRYDNLA